MRQRNGTASPVPNAVETAPAAVPASEGNTISFDELPDWRKDNPSILTGYRRTLRSYYKCFASVFAYVHNETGKFDPARATPG